MTKPKPATDAAPSLVTPHRRRPRYRGTHPRRFHEKYKELNPEKYAEDVAKVLASGKTPAGTHRPIMVREIIAVLAAKPGDVAVDCTLGYGGHAEELLRAIMPGGRLLGLDQDPVELPKTEARLRAKGFGPDVLVARRTNFAGLPQALAEQQLAGADVVLADLGLSSMQIDNPARGFTFKAEGPLDLRMNPERGQPASALLAKLDEPRLAALLAENADEPRAGLIAAAIVRAQAQQPITTTTALAGAVRAALRTLPKQEREQEADAPVRRVFQALRIAVNDEFGALDALLRHLPACLKPGGRAAILTFHSGEDRRVKKAFAVGRAAGVYSTIADEVTRPGAEEVRANSRASSAKLRWAVRSEKT
ncbi:MAG TPA: 16S rRNA (cytosine(1402)-N(4))-methyltransferase RsmH [Verrucomicrobiae bacterium]